MYRYLALLERGGGDTATRPALDARLRALGLRRAAAWPGVALYAAADTPVRVLPGGGALVGHVFARDGQGADPLAALASPAAAAARVRHLVEACWGEYLLLAPEASAGCLCLLRDPSGGVGCVHALHAGFVTSDISLATCAGLCVRRIDWDFVAGALRYPHLKTGRTGLDGIRELLPGCRLMAGDGPPVVEPAWTPWHFVHPERRLHDPGAARACIRQAVASCVRQWAATDAARVLELSGGLDSSIVAACLRDGPGRTECCNLVTPVPGADERRYARQMADVLGAKLHERELGFEDTPVDFPPSPQAVMPGTWFLQHASNALKEAIGRELGIATFYAGGGGDTVFCHTRTAAPAADAFRAGGWTAGLVAIRDLAELHQCTVWKAARLTLRKLRAPPRPPRRAEHTFLPAGDGPALEPHPWFAAPARALPGDRERIFDLAGTQVFREALARSANGPLRMPLLSQPVVEACLRVPSWHWIAGGRDRAVARDAFADRLPPAILHRRSKGTFLNYAGAVFRRNSVQIREHLLAGRLAERGLLDLAALEQAFDHGPAPRDGDTFMRLFDLCAIENWVRHQA